MVDGGASAQEVPAHINPVLISGSWIFRGCVFLVDGVAFLPVLSKLFLLNRMRYMSLPSEPSFHEPCPSSSKYRTPVGLTLDPDPFRLGLRLRSGQSRVPQPL